MWTHQFDLPLQMLSVFDFVHDSSVLLQRKQRSQPLEKPKLRRTVDCIKNYTDISVLSLGRAVALGIGVAASAGLSLE